MCGGKHPPIIDQAAATELPRILTDQSDHKWRVFNNRVVPAENTGGALPCFGSRHSKSSAQVGNGHTDVTAIKSAMVRINV